MRALLVGVAGAGLGFGVWLTINALRGNRVLPTSPRLVPGDVPDGRTSWWLALAGVPGAATWGLTGWPILGCGVVVLVWAAPAAFGGTARRREEARVAEGVAAWTNMIRDTMAGAAGLETAVMTTAVIAPPAIRPQLGVFTARLRHGSLADALPALRTDLNHPSADLLVAALGAAARFDARDIGGLLEETAKSIRADVEMRARVEVGRARIRTSARLVTAANLALFVLLVTAGSQLLAVYDTPSGQAFLALVVAVWLLAFWLFARLSRFDLPERFSLRERSETEVVG